MDSLPGRPAEAPHWGVRAREPRYMAIWAFVLLLQLAAVAGLCALVDPYRVLGTPAIAGLTARKPAAADRPRLSKAYMVQRAHPATLILGSSSADLGFDPDSPAWPAAARPVFNLALEGALPDLQLRYLQHALSTGSPAHVVLAVNFIESLVLPHPPLSAAMHSQFDYEQRMRVRADFSPNPDYARGHLADLAFATLSFDALSDSLRTLLHRNDAAATNLSAAGWNNGALLTRWTRDEGVYDLVMRKDREKTAQYARWRRRRIVQTDPFIEAVRLACAHGADVTGIILPNHADGMESLRQLGLDADYDAWMPITMRGKPSWSPALRPPPCLAG